MNRNRFIDLPRNKSRARVNDTEQLALEQLAKFEAVKLSEAVRLAIREAAKSRGLWPPKMAEGVQRETA